MDKYTVAVVTLITAGFFILAAYVININGGTASQAIQDAIKLASAVVGFAVSVYGGVKAFAELAKTGADFNASAVQAASVTGASGALLLLASRI